MGFRSDWGGIELPSGDLGECEDGAVRSSGVNVAVDHLHARYGRRKEAPLFGALVDLKRNRVKEVNVGSWLDFYDMRIRDSIDR